MVGTERESDNRREAKRQTCWCCRDQQKACRLQQKVWPQCHRESSWQVRKSRLCQKEKEQSRLFRVPDHEGGESQDELEAHLGEIAGDQSGSMERKKWTP